MSDCLKCGQLMPAGSIACLSCGTPNYLLMAQGLGADDELIWQKWDAAILALWMRDGFVCSYCGRDMFESYDVAYHAYAFDHLLPASKYPELKDVAWNNVLSCRACNSFKTNADPNAPAIYVEGRRPTFERNDPS